MGRQTYNLHVLITYNKINVQRYQVLRIDLFFFSVVCSFSKIGQLIMHNKSPAPIKLDMYVVI